MTTVDGSWVPPSSILNVSSGLYRGKPQTQPQGVVENCGTVLGAHLCKRILLHPMHFDAFSQHAQARTLACVHPNARAR